MDRNKRLKFNTYSSLASKLTIMISGVILPRLILSYYGSEINGLVNSITQFLSIITFLDLGVGSVVQSALYKPLAQNDNKKISNILSSAKLYFRRIAFILILYIILLILIYPLLVNNTALDWVGTTFLILAISINQFGQYYFGIVNELLLNADQRAYIQLNTEILVVILNLIISVFLLMNGAEIHTVKFISGLIFLIRPLILYQYVKKHYSIHYINNLKEDPLPQKWNGVGQHIAYSVQNSTDIVVLTIFSSLENVSIYSVYNMIANAIKLIIQSFTIGLQSYFGGIIAEGNFELLNKAFTKIEWKIHNLAVLLYGICTVLITSFVLIYTAGVTDVNYDVPLFAFFLVISGFLFSIRTPYQSLVFSAGHFKETQFSSIIEAVLNIFLSVLLVNHFGLVGVSIGTSVAVLYRTFYLATYLSKNILNRHYTLFIKQILVDLLNLTAIIAPCSYFINIYNIMGFSDWLIISVLVGIYSLFILVLINFIFYRENLINIIFKKI